MIISLASSDLVDSSIFSLGGTCTLNTGFKVMPLKNAIYEHGRSWTTSELGTEECRLLPQREHRREQGKIIGKNPYILLIIHY